MNSIERIRRFLRVTVTVAADGGEAVRPSSVAPGGSGPSDGGRGEVIGTGGAPWSGEMAAPSFLILGMPPRR